MNEVWKDIKGYEGFYSVSNLGRVRRLNGEVMQYNPQLDKMIPIRYPEKILKLEDVKGYDRVSLSLSNEIQRHQVHRLVAQAFIPNDDDKPCVNHKDSNRKNNCVDNLEWVTYQENERHKKRKSAKMFISINPDGVEQTWDIVRECSEELGLNRSGIERCLKGNQTSYKGYTFRY